MSTPYTTSNAEGKIEVINLYDLEGQASKVIPKGGFDYIRGGAENEWTLKQNTLSFDHKQITPRVFSGIDTIDLTTELLGISIDSPIILSPAAAHGLAHTKGEVATAKGVADSNTIMSQSIYSSNTIAETATAGNGAPQFFQLYINKQEAVNHYFIDEAQKNGIKALILTLDATKPGYREADIINGFTFPLPMANLINFTDNGGQNTTMEELYASFSSDITLETIKKLIDYTQLPVIIKGIQSPEDAELAISIGASAIQVSNHGGRQLDGGPASFDVLNDISKVAQKRVPIIFDSGIRRGEHVFKAIASGADIVALARPILYGLALGGSQGVQSVFEHLNTELQLTMQLAGTKTIDDIKNNPLLSIDY